MLDKSEHDMTQQQAELIELTTMWDRVCKLSVNKQEKLEQAHKLVCVIKSLEFNLLCLETACLSVWMFMTSCYSEAIYSLSQAEDFHQKAQALLDWLASAERQLRYRGALPEEELPLLKQIEEHKVLTGPRKRTHHKVTCRILL